MVTVVLIYTYALAVCDDAGVAYEVRAYGGRGPDGRWEGWLAFVPDDGQAMLQTAPETSQGSPDELAYWAAGLKPTYFRGAFRRARRNQEALDVVA